MAREVLILGATGKIAGHAIDALLANGNDELLLFTRHPQNMNVVDENRETVIKGDVLNIGDLEPAIERADVVYANLRNPEITQVILSFDYRNFVMQLQGLGNHITKPR